MLIRADASRCERCGGDELPFSDRTGQLLHLALAVVTAGLWLLVLLAMGLEGGKSPPCSECGGMRGALGLW